MMNEITQTDNADIIPSICMHEVQTDFLVESKEVQTFVSEMMTTESQIECHGEVYANRNRGDNRREAKPN